MDLRSLYKMAGSDEDQLNRTVSNKNATIVPSVPALFPVNGNTKTQPKPLIQLDIKKLFPLFPAFPRFKHKPRIERAPMGAGEGDIYATISGYGVPYLSPLQLAQKTVFNVVLDTCINTLATPNEVLKLVRGDDYYNQHPEQLTTDFIQCLVNSVSDRKAREQGQVPKGWNGNGYCKACGSIWVPTDLHQIKVTGCPWCIHRVQGVTIPCPPSE